MTTNTSTRLTDWAKLWVTEALKDDYAETNERVVWEVSVVVFPDLSATDPLTGSLADPSALVPLPALVIYLEVPGVTPDAPLYIAPIVAPFALTQEKVTIAVTRALESMRDLRAQLANAPSE